MLSPRDSGSPASHHRAVDGQQDDRPDGRHDDRPFEPPDESPGDSEAHQGVRIALTVLLQSKFAGSDVLEGI